MQHNVGMAQLQEKVEMLNLAVAGLAGLNALDTVITNGFETLIAQMGPLKDLSPTRTNLNETENARLAVLRASHARPFWRSAGSLSVPEMRVAFIFENFTGPPLPRDTLQYRNPGQGGQ